eukprot:695828-Hanusia_phi.AAC.2
MQSLEKADRHSSKYLQQDKHDRGGEVPNAPVGASRRKVVGDSQHGAKVHRRYTQPLSLSIARPDD